MTSVTQRIARYNKEVGQPHGGLVDPKLLTVTQFEDGCGVLDHKLENQHPSTVGMAVDYLSRLSDIRLGPDDSPLQLASEAIRGSLLGARRPGESGTYACTKEEEAAQAALSLNLLEHEDGSATFVMNDDAVRIARELATYDVALRAGPAWYNPESTFCAPDETTTSNILTMVERCQDFFEAYGPILEVGFFFVDEDDEEEERADGGRGGYNILFNSGDGEFLTEDTLWSFKTSASKANKYHLLQLVMYLLMGKQSGLP